MVFPLEIREIEMENNENPTPLIVTEKDFPPEVLARAQGVKVLGETSVGAQALYDALPSVIAKRLRAITPPDFEISELQLSLRVEGKVLGSGISSDVVVRLGRIQNKP
jgi:hypothetical protein